MGKSSKRKKMKRNMKIEAEMQDIEDSNERQMSAKKLSKKQRKKNAQHMRAAQAVIQHRWYQVKVCDPDLPSKEFLEQTFKTMIEVPFTILGYHRSTSSVRFFLEDAAAAQSMALLTKRVQGETGHLMQILIEPCKNFILLNAQQMEIVKQVLAKRYSNGYLDLTQFHQDPQFIEQNLLPVLWDTALFRQILCLVKGNIPEVTTLNLSKNGFANKHIRVMADSFKEKFNITRINLEHNEICCLPDLLKSMSSFSDVVELKLEGNKCLKSIRDPVTYINMIKSQFPKLHTLDGKAIDSFLPNPAPVASTSANCITNEKLEKYLKEYYTCMDSPQRLQLVNAYTTTAEFQIQSETSLIPSGACKGIEGIGVALSAVPLTTHDTSSFALKIAKVEPSIGEVEVSGKVLVAGKTEPVEFLQQFVIVPFNTGLGCSKSLIGFR